MTNILKFKNCKCIIVWILETSDGSDMVSTYDSETFSIQNRQCNLEFYDHHKLYFKSKEQLQSPITVTVSVETDDSTLPVDIILPTQTTKFVTGGKILVWEFWEEMYSQELTIKIMIQFGFSTEDKDTQIGSYLDAFTSVDSLPDDFSKLLETGDYYDAEIKCGAHSLKVHKAILSARSEVLKAMFQSDMIEGRTGVLEIHDIDACYLQDFIHYLYTSSIPQLTFDKAKALYEIGDKYHVKSLMLMCSEYFQDSLSKESLFECFSLADAHSEHKLQHKIKMFVMNKELYLDDEYWAPFCEKFPAFSTDVYRSVFKKRKTEQE